MKRLIIFEFHLLGDAVMSLPFLRAAAEVYEVHVCCSAPAAKIYRFVLPPERIHLFELPPAQALAKSRPIAALRTLNRLRKLRANIAVTVWADVRVHLLMRLLGVPRRIGFPMNPINYYAHHLRWRRRLLHRGEAVQGAAQALGLKPLTTALMRRTYRQHHVADWIQIGEALGLELDFATPWLDPEKFALPPAARPFFERHAGEKIWLLHPGAGKPTRRWPHFSIVLRDFFGRYQIPVVVLDDPTARLSVVADENCLVWPMSTLDDLVGLTAACDIVLGNDSVATHLGAALKKRVVTIFGPGSSDWWAAYATPHTNIESGVCPYRPCYDRCLQPSILCQEDIGPERVLAALETVRAAV
jgi:heptosyltransferase-2